ncbi:MAG: PAS domain-containing protein [Actinobacteria bacterium]|nr:PAS domain-containing protein [Actinomycetota bacterium]MBV9255712.1 PAS domain-containing protein [Actinomycetota bacterium]
MGVASRAMPRQASDATAVRVAARVRAAAAVLVAATGSFLPDVHGRQAALFIVLSLVWVPLASTVLFAADRPGSRFALYGGPVIDLAVLFAVQVLLPDSREAVLLGYLVLVLFAAYTAGRSAATLLAVAVMALTVASNTIVDAPDRLGVTAIVPFTAALLALVLLQERLVRQEARATAKSQRLEGKSEAILARVADAVIVTDPASHVMQCNPAGERIVGRPNAEIVGHACVDVLGLRKGERALDCSKGCPLLQDAALPEVAGGSPLDIQGTPGVEVWRMAADGRRQPLLANASSVLDPDGNVVEIVHSIRDITSLKQAEEAKTLFLATASHELKTPLTVINGFAHTLLHYPDLDDATQQRALEAIGSRSLELTKIVDRLLLSSRIEAGRVSVRLDRIDLLPVLEERVHTLAKATGREVLFRSDVTALDVIGDRDAMVTVIDHLLDNAVKYSPEGGAVAVDADMTDDVVQLRVSDQGIGMDPEQVAHCFDKFWQAESTDVRRFGGTGIGLYIVHSLVEAMGARIDVLSKPAVGTTFVISLPRVVELTDGDNAEVDDAAASVAGAGEPTSIREFMRQIGVPAARKEA